MVKVKKMWARDAIFEYENYLHGGNCNELTLIKGPYGEVGVFAVRRGSQNKDGPSIFVPMSNVRSLEFDEGVNILDIRKKNAATE